MLKTMEILGCGPCASSLASSPSRRLEPAGKSGHVATKRRRTGSGALRAKGGGSKVDEDRSAGLPLMRGMRLAAPEADRRLERPPRGPPTDGRSEAGRRALMSGDSLPATVGLRALLIEDNANDRVLVTGALRRAFDDCVVHEVFDRDGLERALEAGRFDLVITDYGLGWSHGLIVVRELKARLPATPVIMWSGTAGEAVAVEAMQEGVEDFVLKAPEHIPHLVLAVRTALERAAERRATVEAETRYRRLFEHLPHGLIVTTPEGLILEANPALASILGLGSASELVGRSMLEFWADPDTAATRWLETLAKRGAVDDYEVQFTREDGGAIRVRIQARVLRDERGVVTACEGTIEDVTHRRRADEDRHGLLVKLVKAQEEERQRIANDIHDDSIQVMTAVGMRLHLIERKVEDAEIVNQLVKLEEIVDLSIGRLRHQLFELRPPTLDREGLGAALRVYLDQMEDAGGPPFRLEDRLPVEPPVEIRANLYRIAQEALMNVRKHARASLVTVTVEAKGDGVLVGVVDDGDGFTLESEGRTGPGHLGLTAMRERAEMAGGWSEVQSEPGKGTTVQFWVPVRAEPENGTPADG